MNASQRARGVVAALVVGAVLVTGSMFGSTAATAAKPQPSSSQTPGKPPKPAPSPTTSSTPTPPPPPPSPSPTPTTPPTIVVAALGDSITQAMMTCSGLTTCSANSWATGTNTAVQSIATRLNATTRYNNAVSGVKADALLGQAQAAVTQGAQYVTIEIGANDACTPTVGTMTPVGLVADPNPTPTPGTFATSIKAGLAALAASPAQPVILIASIPNLKTLWSINYLNYSARFTWSVLGICQSMLANPSVATGPDDARRNTVQAQVTAYNTVLQQACAITPKCRFDSTIAGIPFVAADISTRDYFHPSIAGQTKLANAAWTSPAWAPLP